MFNTTTSRKFIAPRRLGDKSEIRISKGAPRTETNPETDESKIGKSKTPNPKEACLEFALFWSFEFVSNFGFRASNLSFSFLGVPFDGTQDMLCARYNLFRSSRDRKNSNMFG
jgi:hypothetical protein